MIPIGNLAPLNHPVLDIFLVGFVCASSLVAALFFLRFWRQTHDPLFLAFTIFFTIEGVNEAYISTLSHPNVGTAAVTIVRLLSVLTVIFAIIWKNLA